MGRESSIFSLKGKHALVTGATGHLGREIAKGLAEAGCYVFINGRTKSKCDLVTEALVEEGFSAWSAPFNITSEESIKEFCESLDGRPIDILVNNAYAGSHGSIETTASYDEYTKSYDITVTSVHKLFMYLLPNLRKACQISKEASVINIASMYALVSPIPSLYSNKEVMNPPFYGAAKAALLQWTRYAACEFGREGVRVNAVSPGPFPNMVVQKEERAFVKRLEERVPLGRIGQPSELKGVCTFLASPASSFVNGANIVVDGGWTCW